MSTPYKLYQVRIMQHNIATILVRASTTEEAKEIATNNADDFFECNDTETTAKEIPDEGQEAL